MNLLQVKKWLPLVLVGGVMILIDQLSKAWIVANFDNGEGFSIIFPFLQVQRSMNTGIAFGIGEGGSPIFLVLSLLIISALLWVYGNSNADAKLQHIALGLIIGGALGNVIDRIQHGYVVDFVYVYLPNIFYTVSNVSNFADHAIVIGVPLLLLDGYLQERKEKQLEKLKVEEIPETEVVSEG